VFVDANPMTPPLIVSVVRDFAMYDRCVAPSATRGGCERIVLDNRETNERIPVLYNRVLEQFDYTHPTWLVFCHEDFEWKDDLPSLFNSLPPDAVYGPIGMRYRVEYGWNVHCESCGMILQSNKDGSCLRECGRVVPVGTPVKTLDCVCLIVHSSLVERTGLRFDENLSFDLYAEDFCIAAQERHGIPIRIFPMNARHWSAGTIGERYRRQLAYLRKKWPCVSYPSSCSFCIGGKKGLAWLNGVIKTSGIKTRLKAWLRVMKGDFV